MNGWSFRNLHLAGVLYQRAQLHKYFPKRKVVKLAHHPFPALSLRLVRNAYAGKTSCSAPLLRFHLRSIDISLNLLAFTNQAALDGRGLTQMTQLH